VGATNACELGVGISVEMGSLGGLGGSDRRVGYIVNAGAVAGFWLIESASTHSGSPNVGGYIWLEVAFATAF